MKYLLPLLLLPFYLVSQHTCGTPPPTEAERTLMRAALQKARTMRVTNSGTTCIPIAVHDILDGSNGGAADRLALNRAIANLNYFFLDAGMEFYLCSITSYNSAAHYDHDKATEQSTLLTADLPVSNAMNMYLVNSVTTSSGTVAGYASYPYNAVNSTVSVIDKTVLDLSPNGTVVHEYGHHFNLFHTHEGTSNGNTDSGAENVPRSGTNSNCTDHGDELCDTPADPAGSYNISTCSYTGTGTDINGVLYSPALDNIMSYYSDDCGGVFTAGQISRIASALATRQGHGAYTLNCSAAAVASASGLTGVQNGSQVELSWTDNANNELGYLIERSETSSSSGFRCVKNGGVAANTLAFIDYDITSNKTYYYRVKASNGNCNTYSAVATVPVGLVYCTPSFSSACTNSNISNVTFTGTTSINNTTSCSLEYSDYTATISANVVAGNSYSLSVTKSVAGYTRYLYAYGDFNQDGDFDDVGENLVSASPINYSGTITIPAGAYNGNTRMRILMSNLSSIAGACDQALSYGETEDYTLVVSGGVSATQNSEDELNTVQLSPNPTNGKTTLRFSALRQGEVELRILSSDGLTKGIYEFKNSSGENLFELDVAHLPAGIYLVEIRNGNTRKISRLAKQ